MGFCGSMGADFMQYMVADRAVVPPPCRPHYSERLVYMPHSYFVNVRLFLATDVHKHVCAFVSINKCVMPDRMMHLPFPSLHFPCVRPHRTTATQPAKC